MRTYTLTDRDFQEFYALMEKIEADTQVKYGNGPSQNGHFIIDDVRLTYRYRFIGWRNSVTSGDSYAERFNHVPEEGQELIKREIERLKKLLPEEPPCPK